MQQFLCSHRYAQLANTVYIYDQSCLVLRYIQSPAITQPTKKNTNSKKHGAVGEVSRTYRGLLLQGLEFRAGKVSKKEMRGDRVPSDLEYILSHSTWGVGGSQENIEGNQNVYSLLEASAAGKIVDPVSRGLHFKTRSFPDFLEIGRECDLPFQSFKPSKISTSRSGKPPLD